MVHVVFLFCEHRIASVTSVDFIPLFPYKATLCPYLHGHNDCRYIYGMCLTWHNLDLMHCPNGFTTAAVESCICDFGLIPIEKGFFTLLSGQKTQRSFVIITCDV